MTWNYQLRCLDCKAEYVVSPETISVGPVGDGKVIPDEIIDDIQSYKKISIYNGKVEKIYCPICCLRMFVTIELEEAEFLEWKKTNEKNLKLKGKLGTPNKRKRQRNCPALEMTLTKKLRKRSG